MSDLLLSFRAPTADVRAVRLRTDAFKRETPLEFRKRGRTRTWELRVPRPNGLARLEYQLEVERANGATETVVDPEYAEHASLLRMFDSAVAELELKPFRAALLAPPGDRNETYSASTRYANALASEIVPALRELAQAPDLPGARVGMGASLGALAAFHAHRVHRHLFGGLFLQSGSYFRRATDPQETGFPRFERISRFAGGVLRADSAPPRSRS